MISIIFGTHNRIAKLKQSINSINVASKALASPPEIIILDGGSTDGTIPYLNKLSNVKLIQEGGLHGVTRAYNRGFRLASKPYITWFSDDFTYDPQALSVLTERLKTEAKNTLLSLSINVGDGKGFKNYSPNTPIGAGHKDLFKLVNYWSEDFITYASDNDFSLKIRMSGGRVIAEPRAKITHHINLRDDLHKENLRGIKCQDRYKKLYSRGVKPSWIRTYPNIWINAKNDNELFSKIENVRLNRGWCNLYTANAFGHVDLLKSMNVTIAPMGNKGNYAAVV